MEATKDPPGRKIEGCIGSRSRVVAMRESVDRKAVKAGHGCGGEAREVKLFQKATKEEPNRLPPLDLAAVIGSVGVTLSLV